MLLMSAVRPPVDSAIATPATAVAASGSTMLLVLMLLTGCGTTKEYEATKQLLLSEAVDQSIAAIDFRPMTAQKVYLDTSYIKHVQPVGFVNADYVISALRQQIASAGCLLQDTQNEADVIIEARVGTLGADGFQVTYGVPANSALTAAASAIPGTPPIPAIPEISLARRESKEGAAKIACFAYDRETRQPLWQSGTARSTTTSRDSWFFGIGPFQGGSIRSKTRLVGSGLPFGEGGYVGAEPPEGYDRPAVDYNAEVRFSDGRPVLGPQPQGAAGTPATTAPATKVAETPTAPAEEAAPATR